MFSQLSCIKHKIRIQSEDEPLSEPIFILQIDIYGISVVCSKFCRVFLSLKCFLVSLSVKYAITYLLLQDEYKGTALNLQRGFVTKRILML